MLLTYLESSSGIILASSLSPPPPKPNDPLTPHSAVIDLTVDDDDCIPEAELHPYQTFIASVISVISFHLSLQEGFTPLNARTLVSPSSLPPALVQQSQHNRRERQEALPYLPVCIPEIVAPLVLQLDAYMSSTGSLIISPHSETQPAIRRLSTANLSASSLKDREVFLAPWGEWGRLCQPNDLVDPSFRAQSEESWKSCVASYLQDYHFGYASGAIRSNDITGDRCERKMAICGDMASFDIGLEYCRYLPDTLARDVIIPAGHRRGQSGSSSSSCNHQRLHFVRTHI